MQSLLWERLVWGLVKRGVFHSNLGSAEHCSSEEFRMEVILLFTSERVSIFFLEIALRHQSLI